MTGKFIDRDVAIETLIGQFAETPLPTIYPGFNDCITKFLQGIPYFELVEIEQNTATVNCSTRCADCQFIGCDLNVSECPNYIPAPSKS